MLKSVEIPTHVRMGLRPTSRDYPLSRNLRVFGSDTETCQGKPMTIQVDGPEVDGKEDYLFEYVDGDIIFETFWRWIRARLRPGGVNLCYFHNLNFDLRVLFRKFLKTMYEQNSDIHFTHEIDGMVLEIKILFGKVNKADILCNGTRLQILDSKAFTQASLSRSLKMFGIPQDKLKSPEGLGSINFGELSNLDPRRIAFEEYSRQDARAERYLGLKIMEFHALFSVPPAISLPSYAAKVFRRHFMRSNESIPFPPDKVVKAAEKSYHGGKNGFYLPAPVVREDLVEVDINSAYPHAMNQLPTLTKGQYMRVEAFKKDAVGIYCISGIVDEQHPRAKYRLVYDHAFRPVTGAFKELWHTCYEVEAMIDQNKVKITDLWGYVWRPDPGGENPFKRFVDHFYSKKESTPKSDPHYHFYKIVLNALYGKLVSTIEVQSAEGEDEVAKLREMGVRLPSYIRIDERYDKVLKKNISVAKNWRAGSMYNPFLASLITGHARRYLYDMEIELDAVHSATDSVKTPHLIEKVPGLGGLKVECQGRCFLFRNKLYLHFSKDASYCGHTKPPFVYPDKAPNELGVMIDHPLAKQPLVDSDGQHLCKVALHGYKGPLWVLFDNRYNLIETGKLEYYYTHVVGLREGLRRGLTPCDFIQVPETLDIFKTDERDDLIRFIVRRGGFSRAKETSLHGELRNLTFKESRVRGLVNDSRGLSADHMREICAEEGFFREDLPLSDFMYLVQEYAGSKRKYYGLVANEVFTQYDTLYPPPTEE